MFKDSPAYSGFTTDNIAQSKVFYEEILGLTVEEDNTMGMLTLKLATGADVLIYPKGNQHHPADFTVLNFPVNDIDEGVEALLAKGVTLEHYDGLTDETGVARGLSVQRGPDIAWFKDPAGNILSIQQQQ